MAGKVTKGQKELVRGNAMELVKQGQITLKEAAVRIKVSYRQAKGMYRRYGEGGAALIHRNQGTEG